MKKITLLILFKITALALSAQQKSWIRINQLGYLTGDVKVAVLVSKDADLKVSTFELCDALTGKTVFKSDKIQEYGAWAAFQKSFRLNFSGFTTEGGYFIKVNEIQSPHFRIGNDVYDGTADFLLRYMRQQRCGFNPSLKDSCHTSGGYIVYGDSSSSQYYNLAPYPIFGGWHDASDYLQYVTTTATATYQMLFAYEKNPSAFKDSYQANGLKGKNGIPDILDEAKWGLDWLVKMNPEKNMMFNQVCDDRDHRGMRMPNKDTLTYDIAGSRARPVYRITGEPQGLGKYKNRTTGVSSSAGKFASAFAAGSRVLKPFYPQFTESLLQKAVDAYTYGKSDTGVCQTACNRAPYFYEEGNWVDDMSLAAEQLNKSNKNSELTDDLAFFSKKDTINWWGKDTARHYQYYPFISLSRASSNLEWMETEIKKIAHRGKNNPFQIGTPFIWCSNNYISAAITQMNLFKKNTGNTQYSEVEAAHRDWLFGCNPWGTSMIYGLPTEGVSPLDPHSAFTHIAKMPIDGGLVDGPIYGSIFGKLIGITLHSSDEFAEFQSPLVVFHDDYGDYSTDEPTMDGTASLTYYLSAMETKGYELRRSLELRRSYDTYTAITRLDNTLKTIHLTFTGHEFAEGCDVILRTLKKHNIKASFFFTGDFYRKYADLVHKIKKNGHYLGAHSDKHLLYCDWTKRDSTLITKAEFLNDLKNNFNEIEKIGIEKKDAGIFMPPYEWYNDTIVKWTKQAGLTLINYTSGTLSHADYTTPDAKNYKSSQAIYDSILNYEKSNANGLNGLILLSHIGAGEKRTDKFFNKLDSLLKVLKRKGYRFERF
jgi:peptidoglycan/xylan/chitin deacetylase (PgdA/CDA1 family)